MFLGVLDGKREDFRERSNSVISVRKLDFVILRKTIVCQFNYVLERFLVVMLSADMPWIKKDRIVIISVKKHGGYTMAS